MCGKLRAQHLNCKRRPYWGPTPKRGLNMRADDAHGNGLGFGLPWAQVLALLGGVPPAIRAARGSVSDALAN